MLCSPVSIVDDLPNSQNERDITLRTMSACITRSVRQFRGAAYGIITTQNKMHCAKI